MTWEETELRQGRERQAMHDELAMRPRTEDDLANERKYERQFRLDHNQAAMRHRIHRSCERRGILRPHRRRTADASPE